MSGDLFQFLTNEDVMISDISAAESVWPYQHRFNIVQRPLNQLYVNLYGERSYVLSNGERFRIQGKEILFMPEGSSYITTASAKEGNAGLGVLFALRAADGRHLIAGDRPIILREEDRSGYYEASLRELLAEYMQGGYAILKVKAILYRILRSVASDLEKDSASPERKSVSPALRYLESHLQENPTAEELAALCFLSRSTFFRRFRKEFGTTPVQYHLRLRIEKGRQLLESGMYSVEQAAEQMGFCDTAHFCHTFLRMTGEHPGEVKRQKI